MSDLESKIRDLKVSDVQNRVRKRIREFKKVNSKGNKRWFLSYLFVF